MEIFLNRVDGIDDAIISMYLSKRTLTRKLELKIRREVCRASNIDFGTKWLPHGGLFDDMITPELTGYLEKLFKWGRRHITLLRFIDLSFTAYGMHRGAQDDLDSHAMRMNNRIIRASTRLGEFEQGEMSDYYAGKIIPTDKALAFLGISVPDEIEVDGCPYVRGVNGYILKGYADSNDVKRGLYMLSIPSNFIFRVNLTEFAHIYKERGGHGNAHPELKAAVESMEDQVEAATAGFVDRALLMAIPN